MKMIDIIIMWIVQAKNNNDGNNRYFGVINTEND